MLQTSVICLEDNFEELEHIISELFKIYFEKVKIAKPNQEPTTVFARILPSMCRDWPRTWLSFLS